MQIYILSVGVNDYGGQIQVPNLSCAVNDASNVYRVFRTVYNADGKLLGSSQGPALVGASEPQERGTRAEILQAINEARRHLESEDLFVFFFSGHGVPDHPGYILPHSAEYGRPGTYLMHQTLFGTLATLPCTHIMCFLNCCYAGTAASIPAAMPGIIVSKKRAILYASTDDKTVTPDRLPGSRNGCSPFAQALIDYLESEIAMGASFDPEALAVYLKKHAATTLVADGHTVNVCPVFVSSIPAVGLGNFAFEIRRPGFGLEVSPEHHCATGETLRIPVRLEGAKSERIEWRAQSRLPGFEPARMEFCEGMLELVFQYPGDFDIEIAAKDGGANEEVCHTVIVHVSPGESPPPTVDEQPLELCERAEDYSSNLRITGGTAPFQIAIDGLPEGLQYQLRDPHTICIYGKVRSMGGGGTPLSGDNGVVVRMINIHVKDSAGRDCRECRRLVVFNPRDYCRVDNGVYQIGCKEDTETAQHIREVIQLDMDQKPSSNRRNVNASRAAIDSAAAATADQILREIVSGAPEAHVQVRSYLIKKYPVTMHDWKRFLDETDSPHIPVFRWPPERTDDLKKPVTGITYQALCDYLQWKGTRLPTGREWQVAADGGEGHLFPWGNKPDHTKCNMRGGPLNADLSPVDAFDSSGASRIGTRDMVGNAAEWVDRRVYWSGRRAFAQIFRGGSFKHPLASGIIPRDSQRIGVLFRADETAGQAGETRFDWLGFRDVIDLDPIRSSGQSLVAIPAGDIQIDGGPARHVPEFHMAKYAVSNLEYWEFVRATGHRRPTGWKSHGDTLPFPHDQRHLPVVNVSYLDAHAFCLWRSRAKGGIFRLPTPEQWLAAVQGGESRRFPWGDSFNLQFCNEITSGWGKRVAVFDLPEGQSIQGIHNLVGNVYEWVGPLEVRGGSWLTDCRRLAENWYYTGIENHGHAFDFRKGDVGFRYVLLAGPPGP